MSEIEALIRAYKSYVQLPWDCNLAGPQKVWFALYEPAQERRLRFRVREFEEATRNAQHTWKLFDLADTFAVWMAQHEYREEYFEEPEDMNPALSDFIHDISLHIIDVLAHTDEKYCRGSSWSRIVRSICFVALVSLEHMQDALLSSLRKESSVSSNTMSLLLHALKMLHIAHHSTQCPVQSCVK